MHVLDGVRAVGERPHHRVGVVRIDILADRNDDLAAVRLLRRRALQAAPDFRPRCAVGELQEDDRPQVAQRLVHDDAANALDRELVAQMLRNIGS